MWQHHPCVYSRLSITIIIVVWLKAARQIPKSHHTSQSALGRISHVSYYSFCKKGTKLTANIFIILLLQDLFISIKPRHWGTLLVTLFPPYITLFPLLSFIPTEFKKKYCKLLAHRRTCLLFVGITEIIKAATIGLHEYYEFCSRSYHQKLQKHSVVHNVIEVVYLFPAHLSSTIWKDATRVSGNAIHLIRSELMLFAKAL